MRYCQNLFVILLSINLLFIQYIQSDSTSPNCPGRDIVSECDGHCDGILTTNFGTKAPDDQNSLKAGPRGPVLMEDFHFREKMTHFDHERIPERVVHARGSGAHGYFELYQCQSAITTAKFLNGDGKRTPVFVRFSTVAGSRGSTDTPRDVRGFATRFYTEEGNFDLVGNNIPIFFIQDGIRFPDLIHAVKPEPNNEIPQAASAHDNFWDFVSLSPETTAMIMWIMSDRALPRYLSTMEGFGVHTFRLLNAQNETKLVKFHWKPMAGVHSTLWDEAQKLAGKDTDFHRRNLYESIENGIFPEWELGLQIVDEDSQLSYGFDLLDATKLIPEEIVPVTRIGKLVLNRNPDNFFAETEQIAFHPAHIVPGIGFTDDPLLQGRLFSYIDTQINRFSSTNYLQLPINRPLSPVRNNLQDGFMRYQNRKGRVNYEPNSFNKGGCPFIGNVEQGAYLTWPQDVAGKKVRERSPMFGDYFSQAALFYNSLAGWEKEHVVEALRFELSKVETIYVRERMIARLNQVNNDLARRVASAIGVDPPASPVGGYSATSPALSQNNTVYIAKGLKVGIIAIDGFNYNQLNAVQSALNRSGIASDIISTRLGKINSNNNNKHVNATKALFNSESVFYDGLFVPAKGDGVNDVDYNNVGRAEFFVVEAFKHCKPIGLIGNAAGQLLSGTGIKQAITVSTDGTAVTSYGVVTLKNGGGDLSGFANQFVSAVIQQRFYERQTLPVYDRISV